MSVSWIADRHVLFIICEFGKTKASTIICLSSYSQTNDSRGFSYYTYIIGRNDSISNPNANARPNWVLVFGINTIAPIISFGL